MPAIPRSVPAAAVGTAGVVGSGGIAWGILTSIAGKLSGSDWISVVALAITTVVILFGLAAIAVAAAFMLSRGSTPSTGPTAPDPLTLILMSGLALVTSGLVVIAIVVLVS